jgi:hypothetical protein
VFAVFVMLAFGAHYIRTLTSEFGKGLATFAGDMVDESAGALQLVPSLAAEPADFAVADPVEIIFRVVHLNPSRYKRPTAAYDNLSSGGIVCSRIIIVAQRWCHKVWHL